MPNIYDTYLQFKAIGAIQYNDELLVVSKEIDTVLSQDSPDEAYQSCYILPCYQIASIVKNDIAANNKFISHKIKNGKILFDNINFIAKLQNYIHFLLKQKSVNTDFLFVRRQLSAIRDNMKDYGSLQNPRLKEISLSAVKQKAINLYDSFYFDKEKIITQIEKSECQIEQKQFFALNKLINLTAKTDTKKLEKTVEDLIAQNPVLSYYQSINKTKDFDLSKQLFITLQTSYPFEDIIFDIKTSFERATKSQLYSKYDSPQQQSIFEITGNGKEKHQLYDRLIFALQNYLEKSKTVFKLQLTDACPDIWAFELYGSKAKQPLNDDLHSLMIGFRNHWTQDYAVSVSLIIISKILKALYKNEMECSDMINMLYENWVIFLFENYTTTDIYQFNKNKEFRISSLAKQVDAMSNDITLLSEFSENEEISKRIQKIQKTITSLVNGQPKDYIKKDSVILGLLVEVCSSLGVYKKNLPYIALLIKTHKESLWKII